MIGDVLTAIASSRMPHLVVRYRQPLAQSSDVQGNIDEMRSKFR